MQDHTNNTHRLPLDHAAFVDAARLLLADSALRCGWEIQRDHRSKGGIVFLELRHPATGYRLVLRIGSKHHTGDGGGLIDVTPTHAASGLRRAFRKLRDAEKADARGEREQADQDDERLDIGGGTELDAARIMLGHSNPELTLKYAQR